jgi:3-dehydroquinate synthase
MINMKSNLTYLKKPDLFKELDLHQDSFYAVIDEAVRSHLPDWIKASKAVFWLKNPEEDKNLNTFGEAVSFFLDQGISRTSKLHAIGGGATTDLAGFVAATVVRGVSWISIPTTLLAIVDGSIGGKVGVNMPQGKNLVGAFYAPEKVLICLDFLSTLPKIEWESGKGEVLKYGLLSKKIYDRLIEWEKLAIALEIPLEQTKLSHYPEFSVDKFKNYLLQDKKKNKNIISLVLVKAVGNCFVEEMNIQDFIKKIEANEEFKG